MATGGDRNGHDMGMTLHERRELHLMEQALRRDEPLLAAYFDTWTQAPLGSGRRTRRLWRLFRRR